MARGQAPGWFGKIAVQGDFASRRLPPTWVQVCDDWLSACVAASKEQLGGQWQQVYLSAPVWRFAWAPGVIDEQWWFGVLMPSCDNVGRYFPLVVVQSRPVAPSDRIGLDHLDLWWSHTAAAALATLEDSASVENFEQALENSPPWPGGGPVPATLKASPNSPGLWQHTAAAGASLSQLIHGLAAGQFQKQLADKSFWWPLNPAGSAHDTAGKEILNVAAGLPPPENFAAMLAGNW